MLKKKKFFGIIYKVSNKINGKMYIGQTAKSLNKRIDEHVRCALNNRDAYYFHNAIRKYGKENFVWETIAKCNSQEELNKAEIKMIEKHNTFENGYNLNLGGHGNNGFKHSEKTKKQISESHMGKTLSEESKIKMSKAKKGIIPWNKNKKGLQVAWNKGVPFSDEAKAKMSEASNNVGKNNPMYGRKHLEYSKELIAKSKSFKWLVIDPFGRKFIIENLKKFCRKNNLDQSSLWRVAYRKKYRQHKGYKCKRLYEDLVIVYERGVK